MAKSIVILVVLQQLPDLAKEEEICHTVKPYTKSSRTP